MAAEAAAFGAREPVVAVSVFGVRLTRLGDRVKVLLRVLPSAVVLYVAAFLGCHLVIQTAGRAEIVASMSE